MLTHFSSYELPHRIHTAKAYPLRSHNGSTIVIYGQENGVRIVWRGGRAFKAPAESSAAPKKANGADNAVISLDSDDDGPSAPAFEDKPEFEEEKEELDPSRPYPAILQCLDLYFGTDALHLAILPTSILKAEGASWRGLDSLKQKIVFVASCADNSVRLVTLPLTPPSPLSKSRPDFRSNFITANAGNGKWGETVVVLGGHQKPSDGVSMTVDFSHPDQAKGDSRSATPTGPQLIVASHSREVTGLLLLYRIPITSPKPHIEPFQSIYLLSPAKSISFNPALSSPPASQLLVADSVGACRIYDYKLLIKTTPADEPIVDLAAEQGTWLLSLYPSFQKSSESSASQNIGAHAGFGRKTITDAKWVSNGRAILVLLQDGEWGIWDIEGVGPGASQGLLGRQGIKGGSLSQFSLTGFIEGASKAQAAPQQSGSKFAPMTPGTRKSVDLFGTRASTGPVQGQISVIEVPSGSATRPADESIVFWLGESFTVIPNLSKYWAANSRKSTGGSSNLFNGTPGGRMIKLENIDLQGERCSGIEQIAQLAAASSVSTTALSSEVVILGEHRLVVLSADRPRGVTRSENRLALVETDANAGELDVVGIERALARMDNRDSNPFLGKRKLLQ